MSGLIPTSVSFFNWAKKLPVTAPTPQEFMQKRVLWALFSWLYFSTVILSAIFQNSFQTLLNNGMLSFFRIVNLFYVMYFLDI